MKARSNRNLLLALVVATSGFAADEKVDPASSTTVDRLRAAFLEDAPAADTKSMKAALAEECDRVREEPLQTEAGDPIDVAWLCGAKSLRYLTEVLLNGTKVDTGYICDPVGLEDVKFLPLDMLEHQSCVWVGYDFESKMHDLDLASQLGAADPATTTEPATATEPAPKP
jgi:hypothetical protein